MEKETPALPEIIEGRDKLVVRIGDSEVVQTKDCITIRVQCKNRPDFGLRGDSSK